MSVMSLENIAVDAWLLTLLDPEDVPKGAIANMIGQNIGQLITYSIFGILSSKEFLNKWFFTKNPVEQPLFTPKDINLFIAVYSVISLVIVMNYVAEKHVKRVSFCAVMKKLP